MRFDREDYQRAIVDLRDSDDPEGIPLDEPVFLLRANDMVAWLAVMYWVDLAKQAGASKEMLARAQNHANLMANWPGKKVPDLPEGA